MHFTTAEQTFYNYTESFYINAPYTLVKPVAKQVNKNQFEFMIHMYVLTQLLSCFNCGLKPAEPIKIIYTNLKKLLIKFRIPN